MFGNSMVAYPPDMRYSDTPDSGRVLVSLPIRMWQLGTSGYRFHSLRNQISFDPANARRGDRIGKLTVISRPVENAQHDACHWIAHPSNFSVNVEFALMAAVCKFSDLFCKGTVAHYHADVRCDCGAELKKIELTGDRNQWIACRSCYRAMLYDSAEFASVA